MNVPKGNTQRNVNKTIIVDLLKSARSFQKHLDIPCGKGEFIKALQSISKKSFEHAGVDILPLKNVPFKFHQKDLSKPFALYEQYDLITSVSGLTELYNTERFITTLNQYLQPGGTMVLTNDNALSIKSRLSFLLFGKISRFRPLQKANSATFKYVPQSELIKIIIENKLNIEKVKYTAWYYEDLIFLPLALIVFPLQKIYLARHCRFIDKTIRDQLFSFSSLFCRHYIFYLKKVAQK